MRDRESKMSGMMRYRDERVDDPKMPWRQARYHSNCDDSFLPITVPSDTLTTFENEDYEIATKRRLLLPITILIVGRRLYVRDVRWLQTLGVSVLLLNPILTYSETMRCVAQVLVVALGLNSGTTHLS